MRLAKILRSLILLPLTLASASLPAAAQTEWQPVEQVEPYSISGTTGPELYASIGERGPVAGKGRAIGFTNFDLTWRRDYRPQPDGACTLVTARPRLIISYVLPRPSQKLKEPVASNWQTFSEGLHEHEREHGRMIVEMVEKIVAFSVGLSVQDDPNCKNIRTKLTERLSQLSQERQQKSRHFDRVELTEGGAVHQLVLNLVNGG